MKANELRVGNYVNINYTIEERIEVPGLYGYMEYSKTVYGIVTRLTTDNEDYPILAVSDEADVTYFDSITGIPLTEEWLLKFGYVKHENGAYSLDVPNNTIRFFEKELPLWRLNGFDFYFKIEFVHQFQNIFFAHNRYELTLKP